MTDVLLQAFIDDAIIKDQKEGKSVGPLCVRCGRELKWRRNRFEQKEAAIKWLMRRPGYLRTALLPSELLQIARELKLTGIYSPKTWVMDIKVEKLIRAARERKRP